MLTATLSYSPSLVRRATFAYLRRGFGTGGIVAFAFLVVLAAVVVTLDPWSWLAGAFAGATVVVGMLLAGLYLVHYRQAMAKLNRMGAPHAVLELTPTDLRVTSGAGSFSAPWHSFSGLWRFKDFWLLIIGKGQFMTLPLADLSSEAQELILAHVGSRTPMNARR